MLPLNKHYVCAYEHMFHAYCSEKTLNRKHEVMFSKETKEEVFSSFLKLNREFNKESGLQRGK